MTLLILGLVLFLGGHLAPTIGGTRDKLIARLGERAYKGLYSLIALIGLILIIYGKSIAEFRAIWEPAVWTRYMVFGVMIAATFLITVSDMKSNIKRLIRHPMLVAIALWSGAHLGANGDLASILLFGSFLVYSVLAMITADWRAADEHTKVYSVKKDIIVFVVSIVVYIILVKYFHPYLIGKTII